MSLRARARAYGALLPEPFGESNREGGMERAMEGKGTEWKRKEAEGK